MNLLELARDTRTAGFPGLADAMTQTAGFLAEPMIQLPPINEIKRVSQQYGLSLVKAAQFIVNEPDKLKACDARIARDEEQRQYDERIAQWSS